jgi:predicted Zn-dependent protease
VTAISGPNWTEPGLIAAHEVIEEILALGNGECVALVEESNAAEVRFANNTTTTNGVRRDRRVTVIRMVETGSGIATGVASRSGDADHRELIANATHDALSSPPSADAFPLVDGASSEPATFQLAPGRTDLSVLADVLADLRGTLGRAESAGSVLAGFATHSVDTLYLGTSTGLRLRHCQPTGSFQMIGRRSGGSNSAWVGQGTADFADVSIEAAESELVRRLEWGARTHRLDAGRYPVVLPPDAVADLMIGLVASAGTTGAAEGRTVFSAPEGGTRVGDVLARLPFQLASDPNYPGLECAPFASTTMSGPDTSIFDNGLPLSPTRWIDEGRLTMLRSHRAGAAAAGVAAAPSIDNLVLELPGASGTVDELVARTERGLLLTCLWYIREVDAATLLMTGLTRDGVYLVEDGAVVGAVNNFRFNESPVDLLARATDAGGTVRALGREYGEWVNRTAMPPVCIPDFNMSSVSAAT